MSTLLLPGPAANKRKRWHQEYLLLTGDCELRVTQKVQAALYIEFVTAEYLRQPKLKRVGFIGS